MEYTIYYRNYLRYCNYKCTYCPFSKYKLNNNQLSPVETNLKKNLFKKINFKIKMPYKI